MQVQAMAGLLPTEQEPLRRFALSLTRNLERAEDLVQDTMERALIKAHLFDGSNLRSWLCTMCRRIYFNNLRWQKVRGVNVPIDDAPESAVTVETTQETNLHMRRVVECFERLPVGDKVVLALIVLDGLSYEEAAVALGVPIGTIRSRLSRARDRLSRAVETTEDKARRSAKETSERVRLPLQQAAA